jgi:hypothetical protein
MLVGSGGVVALVLGAWAVLWALVSVPGTSWHRTWPVIAAFCTAILAFAMLTAQAEIGLGLVQWAKSAPDGRAAVASDTLSTTWRPLAAAIVADLSFALAILGSRTREPARDEPPAHRLERVAGAAMIGLALLDVIVWVSLQRAFSTAVSGDAPFLSGVPPIRWLSILGVVASLGILVLASAVGLRRALVR